MPAVGFTFPAPDGAHEIHGYIDRAAEGVSPESRLLVLSHGLTGSPEEPLHQAAADYFAAAGYDVIRFFYYGGGEKSRDLSKSTLLTHAEDLAAVVSRYRDGYDKIYVAGHSYGGLAMLIAQIPATAYAFWDSSFAPSWWQETSYDSKRRTYRWKWGAGDIGQAMYDEARNQTIEKSSALAGKLATPSLVVVAGKEQPSHQSLPPLYRALRVEKELVVLKNADHVFSTGNSTADLLALTRRWFARF